MMYIRQQQQQHFLPNALFIILCISISLRIGLCLGGEIDEDSVDSKGDGTIAIPSIRAHRFPSVESRIKLYSSNWYTPPCQDDNDGFIRYSLDYSDDDDRWPKLNVTGLRDHPLVNQTTRIMTDIQSIVEPDMLFFMDEKTIINCANYSYDEEWGEMINDPYMKRIEFRHNMRMYCEDIQDLLLPVWYHLQLEKKLLVHSDNQNKKVIIPPPPPTLIQFGDNKQSHVYKDVMVPHIKKFRSAALKPEDLVDVTSEQCYSSSKKRKNNTTNNNDNDVVIRKALNSAHGNSRFQPIVWKLATDRHYKKLNDVYRYDTQWSHKKNMAVFRGQLTGSRDGYDKHLPDEKNCHNLKRCRLVYNHANSTLIYARLTSTRGRMPDVLDGVELVGDKVKIDSLLEYKGIIMIEGNDVASGLKWALLSQSIVLMPNPKHTSWCMEELLQPWVHYVPLNDFATNVEERMQWIIDNDEEAQRISERATLWMEDLVFHPDAAEDDRLIQEEILRRYQSHFIADKS